MRLVKTKISTRIVLKIKDCIVGLWSWIKKTFTGENVLTGLIVLFVLSLLILVFVFAFYGMLFIFYLTKYGLI
jgi:hypothetical protein